MSCPATCGHEGVSAAVKDLLLAIMKSLNGKRDHLVTSWRVDGNFLMVRDKSPLGSFGDDWGGQEGEGGEAGEKGINGIL